MESRIQHDAALVAAQQQQVPSQLLQQLHDANQLLHDARAALEAAMDDSNVSHQQRIDQAESDLRAAEQALEQVSDQIHKAIAGMPAMK